MGNYLVTGADGFIGSHLVEQLLGQGHKVRALALYNSFGDIGWLRDLGTSDNLQVTLGDIRDYQICEDLVQGVDGVFHLAALIGIPYSYSAVDSYIQTNVTGTSNICRALVKMNKSPIITMSTSEVYGTARQVPINESHPLQAQSPYSASKIAADAMATSYHSAFELPLTIARPFNTYGPRQSRRAFIPSVISQIINRASEIKVGDTSTTRDLSFVEDTAKSLIALMSASNHNGEVFNIGTNNEYSIAKIIEIIQELCGSSLPLSTDPSRIRPEKSEVQRLVCDNSKLLALTGQVPDTEIKKGLLRTIDWMKANASNKSYSDSNYAI
jgi:NAD dependent epimerase/dehydratase